MSDNPAVEQQKENTPQDHPTVPAADAALSEKDLDKIAGGGMLPQAGVYKVTPQINNSPQIPVDVK